MNAEVDPIEHRSRELAAIALDLVGKAGAFALGVAPEAARAWVHRSNEHESRGIRRGAAGAGDRHGVFLERLAKCVEDASQELGDLVQEQRAAMRQAHFAWTRRRSAADERVVRRGVMRCT